MILDLVEGTAAPRLVPAGGRYLLVSPPDLRGFATLIAHLAAHPGLRAAYEEVYGEPPPRDWQPSPGARPCRRVLIREAFGLLLYVATRADQPGLSYDEAAAIAADMGDPEAIFLVAQVALLGRPVASDVAVRAGRAGGGDDDDDDEDAEDPFGLGGFQSVDYGLLISNQRRLRQMTPRDIGRLTPAQLVAIVEEGRSIRGATGIEVPMEVSGRYVEACRAADAEGRPLPEWDDFLAAERRSSRPSDTHR